MTPKCKECGAPVSLVPDGDPRYKLPSWPDRYFIEQEGFQAGLKQAAEIAEFLSDTLVDGLEDTASQSERDYAERKAVEIQQAILKEIIP